MEDEQTFVEGNSLTWTDWLVIGLMLFASASVGLYYRFTGGRQKTAEEYFSADRSVGVVMLSFAMMIAYLSAISLLGSSGENYIYGAQFNLIYIGTILGTPIITNCYLPVFYELRMMSVFEYLEKRFGTAAKFVASTANFIQFTLYTGVVIYAPALALEATTGLNGTMSILLIGLICTFYSSIGGIKAVIITDLIQGLLMFMCVYCIISIALKDIEGGVWQVFQIAYDGGRLNFFNFNFDPTIRHTWWSLVIGGTYFFLSIFAVSQVQVQRMLTARTINDARNALWMNIPMTLALALTISFSGLVLYAFYFNCDPVVAGKIKTYDMIMPYFAKDQLTSINGLTGLFIAGVFSASLSTVSAMLNSLAAVILSDYIKPIYKKLGREFPNNKAAVFGKILGVTMGLISVAIAFLASKMGALIQAVMAIHGAIGGPILGLFTLGMFVESANEVGAIIGTIIALGFNMWVTFSPKPRPPRLPVSIDGCPYYNSTESSHTPTTDAGKYDNSSYMYISKISYLWFTPIGVNMVIVIGYIASIIIQKLTNQPAPIHDPNLFTPLVASRIRQRRDQATNKSGQIFVLSSSLNSISGQEKF